MKRLPSILLLVIATVLLSVHSRPLLADDVQDLTSQVKQAIDDIAAANAKAQQNMPNKTVKAAEDKLDQAARQNDDTPNPNPKSSQAAQNRAQRGKTAAQNAEDAARAHADDVNNVFNNRGDKYREALKERREARKRLKEALAALRRLLGRARRFVNDTSDIEKGIHDANRAMPDAERTLEWEQVPLSMAGPNGAPTINALASAGTVKLDSVGTGNTIGHIADLKVQNLTDQPISCFIPPMILESTSGKNQHYACPKGQTVAIKPHDTATVPMDGVCINRHKPPVGKGVTGDLVINTGDPTAPQNPDSHVPAKDANKLLRIAKSKYDAADKLQKDGELKDLPYHDKQKQKDIVVQWSTWTDPDISEIVGGPPATKDDLKKVVYKQVEENGPMTPETKKKVDQGIDTIFEKVELTSKKAKDLEEPDQYAETEAMPPNTVEIGDHTGGPTTQERPRGKGRGKGKGKGKGKQGKKWPKPIQEWVDKRKAAQEADRQKDWANQTLSWHLEDYCEKTSEHYADLEQKRAEAARKARAKDATKADKDEFDRLNGEIKKLRQELAPDFQKTDQGKKDFENVRDAEKAADAAHEAEEEAGKNIDPATKSVVGAEEDAVPAVW
jgi:hypothetical protein